MKQQWNVTQWFSLLGWVEKKQNSENSLKVLYIFYDKGRVFSLNERFK